MLEIASTVTRYFNKLEDIKDADAGVYCIPMSPNFPAIDALEQPSKQQPASRQVVPDDHPPEARYPR